MNDLLVLLDPLACADLILVDWLVYQLIDTVAISLDIIDLFCRLLSRLDDDRDIDLMLY